MPYKTPPSYLAVRTEDCGCEVVCDRDAELWIEFCPLHEAASGLLAACEYGHGDDEEWTWLIFTALRQNQLDDLAEKFRAKMQMECAATAKANQTD